MARKIRWSLKASEQLFDSLEYWKTNNHNSNYASKLFEEVESILDLICRFPELGRKTVNPNVRRVVIERNYGLYYSYDNETVEIKLWKSLKMDPEKNEFEN